MKNFEIIWLALGIILTTATQFRIPSIPIGAGEIMVFSWIVLVFVRVFISKFHLVTSSVKVMTIFWIFSFAALNLGALSSLLLGIPISFQFYHDTFAFLFAFIFSIAFLITVKRQRDLQKILLIAISFAIICLLIILVLPSNSFVIAWQDDARFLGWSQDPNQLAILLVPMPFVCLYLRNHSSSKLESIWCILLIVGALIFGIATASDGLRVCWSIALPLMILLMSYRQIIATLHAKIQKMRLTLVKNNILIFLIFIVGLLIAGSYQEINNIMSNVYNYRSQGDVRVTLWLNGIAAVLYSPLFGLGPGPHSGYEAPLLEFEAHNTFIDWAGSTGIVGLIAYLALLAWIYWNAWKSGLSSLTTALITLIGYSCFIYTIRHIVFWFYLLIIISSSTNSLQLYIINHKPQQILKSKIMKN